jgi:hypothetical protein
MVTVGVDVIFNVQTDAVHDFWGFGDDAFNYLMMSRHGSMLCLRNHNNEQLEGLVIT